MAMQPLKLKLKTESNLKQRADQLERQIDAVLATVTAFDDSLTVTISEEDGEIDAALENVVRRRYLDVGWDSMSFKLVGGDQREPGYYKIVLEWKPKTPLSATWLGTIGES